VRHTGNGIEAKFGAFKRPLVDIMGLLFGLVSAAIGAVTLARAGPLMAGGIFLLLGSFFACSGIFGLGKSLLVSVSPQGLRTRRFLFGYPLRTRKLARADFSKLKIVQAGSMKWGNRSTVFYTLQAQGQGKLKLTVAERLTGRSEAEFLRESYLTYLGGES
jgi:hypothetical protein